MVLRNIGVFFSATLIATTLFAISTDQAASAKSSKSHRHPGGYFVPPPPPYAPSILPERLVRPAAVEQVAEEAVKPVENPYSKYIFTRDASNMPRVVQPNRTQISYRTKT
jgi:hypothetical protein